MYFFSFEFNLSMLFPDHDSSIFPSEKIVLNGRISMLDIQSCSIFKSASPESLKTTLHISMEYEFSFRFISDSNSRHCSQPFFENIMYTKFKLKKSFQFELLTRFNLDTISHRNGICFWNEHYSSYVITESSVHARNGR